MGQLFTLQGKDHVSLQEIGPGDIGAVAKLKEVATGDVLTTGPAAVAFAADRPAAAADELRRDRPQRRPTRTSSTRRCGA